MSITVERISDAQAEKVIQTGEGQFSDIKAIEIAPKTLTKCISAFANSDGGDLYVGIAEIDRAANLRKWDGFTNQESANGHLQIFEELFPLGTDFQYDLCNPYGGVVRDKAGNLYGTTYQCGSSGFGTVWKLDKTGKETVMHNFKGGAKDGSYPGYGGLILDAAGKLQKPDYTAAWYARSGDKEQALKWLRIDLLRIAQFHCLGKKNLSCFACSHKVYLVEIGYRRTEPFQQLSA
jgi:uncharacterized repeat protein (TIGR03803 family)